ncbi:MAG TPA: restriction endonuclease subunit S [Thermoclostridium caenicola]|uniref:Type I restriction enzyme, S subunit n=1 Tax=Thermoclostridium caenicola TaxID=659425 RepID=A0A1M6E2Q0_9FIRM|nr:restriction endonuclease subunit S [Thermoclostridium caenicola]SHI79673.1 type I restriction enzyme, S subunit [Thermoclostridium caenicola]HOK42456.1 restriction endonuclease subunit S [Thermoclostridium caenicola]HOL84527.1 restriction endonuclease subunit S [Thermoclostridium caenicola]HPO76663.1 restriction endonuclease subunit S [Thermoclostridium caenicola]
MSKTRLGDICTIIKGTKVEQTEQDCNSIRYIQIEDLRSNECIKYCEKKEHYVIANPRDIIIAWDGANAGTVGFGLSGAIGSTLAIIRLNREDFDTRFLGMLLRKKFNYLRSNCTGATIPHINRRSLEEIKIPLLPLETQKQIAKTLDTISELLSLRKQQLAELNNLTKSIFYDMFGDPATNEKGWDIGTIRDIVADVKYGTSKPAQEKGKFIYLRMNNITYDGDMDYSDIKYIDLPEHEVEKYLVKKGDVLFNRTNSKELVGKTAVFKNDTPMVIAGYIIRIRVNERADPEFLSAILNSRYGKETLYGMCKAIIGQANINAQELQNIRIFIPPISLQKQFATIVCKIEEQKSLVRKAIQETQLLFDSLMSQYFDE